MINAHMKRYNLRTNKGNTDENLNAIPFHIVKTD